MTALVVACVALVVAVLAVWLWYSLARCVQKLGYSMIDIVKWVEASLKERK